MDGSLVELEEGRIVEWPYRERERKKIELPPTLEAQFRP